MMQSLLRRSSSASVVHNIVRARSLALFSTYEYSPLFQSNIFDSGIEYKQLAGPEAVDVIKLNDGTNYLQVKGEYLQQLSKQAFSDVAHLLRPAHLQQLQRSSMGLTRINAAKNVQVAQRHLELVRQIDS